jgi:L-rhamnono-1,4-lactonase
MVAPQIVDSHIHLFPESHLNTLSWHSPSNPLGAQHSVHEYRQATSSQIRGFIFLETDRISSLSPSDWNHALDEVSFLARIALGTPIPGEGHDPMDRDLCLGIIPWAPVPSGANAMAQYMGLVRERSGDAWSLVKGVRYLVQDKAPGTMLGDGFVDAVRYLGREGLTFDLGVDARSGGLGQLREAVEMIEKVHEDGEATIVISSLLLGLYLELG